MPTLGAVGWLGDGQQACQFWSSPVALGDGEQEEKEAAVVADAGADAGAAAPEVAEEVAGEAAEGEQEGEEDEWTPRSTIAEQTLSEDELAGNQAYFELLVLYYKENNEVPWYRIDELTNPNALVMVVNQFALLQCFVPELYQKLESRFEPLLEQLDAPHLVRLAMAYAACGCASPEFSAKLAAAAAKAAAGAQQLDPADARNLEAVKSKLA